MKAIVTGNPDPFDVFTRALNVQDVDRPGDMERLANVGVQLLDLTHPEFRWLRRTGQYDAGVNIGAVAAQIPLATLANPVGSQTLLVIEQFTIVNNTAVGTIAWTGNQGVGLAGLGAVLTHNLDLRQPWLGTQAQPVALFSAGTLAVAPFGWLNKLVVGTNTPFVYRQPIMVQPGWQWVFGGNVVNTAISVNCTWYERRLGPQED